MKLFENQGIKNDNLSLKCDIRRFNTYSELTDIINPLELIYHEHIEAISEPRDVLYRTQEYRSRPDRR